MTRSPVEPAAQVLTGELFLKDSNCVAAGGLLVRKETSYANFFEGFFATATGAAAGALAAPVGAAFLRVLQAEQACDLRRYASIVAIYHLCTSMLGAQRRRAVNAARAAREVVNLFHAGRPDVALAGLEKSVPCAIAVVLAVSNDALAFVKCSLQFGLGRRGGNQANGVDFRRGFFGSGRLGAVQLGGVFHRRLARLAHPIAGGKARTARAVSQPLAASVLGAERHSAINAAVTAWLVLDAGDAGSPKVAVAGPELGVSSAVAPAAAMMHRPGLGLPLSAACIASTGALLVCLRR
eukprot:CAMPEP_0202097700 /NCGR_PEP_ID=MMETSP0965-20130614/1349_1 /ASSEMBLY_ACC=CAM_ASM_000507 /TAXON_ID=4773 /ORGANISM="Schizochytrium aggregatum, Strain ATCC28209" /LENGTH=294 /DNA_ID=CAMNT_0048666093 /DNA_START=389 /DNA_END=1273 /DNA_ORIENTATION=-